MAFLRDADLTDNRIEQAAAEQRQSGRPLIDLTCTNPTLNGFLFPPEILVDAGTRYFKTRSYLPDAKGLRTAREAVARYYLSRSPAATLDPEHIVITASTSEAYALLFSVLAEPEESFLAPEVTYPLFDLLAAHQRVNLDSYPFHEATGWAVDYEALAALVDSTTRGVLIVSPHNPTGLTIRDRSEALAATNLPLIADEVFCEFTSESAAAPPLAALYPDLPVFMLNGISKMFALPDLKLGWIAMNEEAYRRFGRPLEILNDSFLGANGLTQHLLPALFEQGTPFLEQMKSTIAAQRNQAARQLQSIPQCTLSAADAGWSLFPRFNTEIDEEELVLELIRRGVLVHPGFFYGAEHGCHLMISALCNQKTLKQGISIIAETLR